MPIHVDLSHAIRHRDIRGKRILHRDGNTGAAWYGANRVRDPEQESAVRSWDISRVRQPIGHPIPDHQR